MRNFSIPIALMLFLATPLAAGVVYEIEVTDHGSSEPRVSTTEVAVEGKNLKMGVASGSQGGQSEAIFRGDRREMVIVDHDSKSFVVMDKEAIGELAGQVNSAMAQLQEALKDVPEDQREMVEKMMKERMPPQQDAPARPRSELKKTGDRAEKAGFSTVKYEAWLEGAKTAELWVTPWSKVEGGAEAQAAFVEMSGFFQEIMDALSGMFAGGMPGAGDMGVFEHLAELDGFPVVTRSFEGGELEQEATLRSASRRTLDPADFEPPAGYKRRSMGPQ